ncbi:MAG: hypothetical protein JWP38_785 [Herbaspirillum sp.]|nr:hypothetical protein [Herbaspirillum sp.]
MWHRSMSSIAAASAAAAFLFSGSAQATIAPLTATQILQQFNLVVLNNDVSLAGQVAGRTYVGGSLNGGAYEQSASSTPASNYAGLTVGGSVGNVQVNGLGAVVGGSLANSTVNSGSSVVGGSVANSNLNGAAFIGGSKSNTNTNGGVLSSPSALMQTNSAAATSTNFSSTLTSLSQDLSKLSSTGSSVSFSGNTATFNAVANSAGVAVFDISAIDTKVFSSNQFSFNANGATTIIINTDVKQANIAANFLGGQAQSLGSEIVWNFYDATNLTVSSQFGGSILATGASLISSQSIAGGVYVNNLLQMAGTIQLQPFSGSVSQVPETASYASMLAGLALIGLIFMRRRKAAARNFDRLAIATGN